MLSNAQLLLILVLLAVGFMLRIVELRPGSLGLRILSLLGLLGRRTLILLGDLLRRLQVYWIIRGTLQMRINNQYKLFGEG